MATTTVCFRQHTWADDVSSMDEFELVVDVKLSVNNE